MTRLRIRFRQRSSWPLLALTFAMALGACADAQQGKTSSRASPDAPAKSGATAAADRARIQGRPTAAVWVIEVSDFQCPYCKMWHDSTYPALKREYVDAGVVRLAYINFPLAQHKNAMPAAEAAMCAAAQEKFWPMQDALFETQGYWETLADPAAAFDSLAESVGVDIPAMRACIAAGTMRPTIAGDIDRAKAAGVESTPTFIIGDQVLAGAQPLAAFRRAIDAAAARATAAPKS